MGSWTWNVFASNWRLPTSLFLRDYNSWLHPTGIILFSGIEEILIYFPKYLNNVESHMK